MKIFCVIAFHYERSRLSKFYEMYEKLISDNIKIVINSNCNFDNNLPIEVSENLDNPFYLTWEHKKYLNSFLESDYDLFSYLEGNILVEKKIFDYWFEYRQLFKKNNLNFIPATHRVRIGDHDNEIYSLDVIHKPIKTRIVNEIDNEYYTNDLWEHGRALKERPIFIIDGKKFISIGEPYQGMFIMDKEMVEEHLNSVYSKSNVNMIPKMGVRESANLGNIFVNIPKNLEHRSVLPIDMKEFERTWMIHFGTNYHTIPDNPHAKIKSKDLFNELEDKLI